MTYPNTHNSPSSTDKEGKAIDLGFTGLIEAVFVDRPNRFLARCRVGKKIVEAFMPNPGRMQEILLPDTKLLVRKRGPGAGPERRTAFTVFAAYRFGLPVFLHTHETNRVAKVLVERGLIEPLKGARVLRSEVPHGHSRFDFLIEEAGRELFMEVKSCTLFGEKGAMFPDAVTERGRRHLLELAALSKPKAKPAVLILVQYPEAAWFLPDYHTDPAFSDAFWEVRRRVRIIPAALRWNPDLTLDPEVKILDIPWKTLERENRDRGAYLLILRLEKPKRIEVGSLGPIGFEAGHHVYVGSALGGLAARIARHGRKRKKFHWHVDHLRHEADGFTALPIRTSKDVECELAKALSVLLEPGPRGFGSSDCSCPTHLFSSEKNPMHLPEFNAIVERFRMAPDLRS